MRNQGLTADPLFVGATRPPMRWGVTYGAILLNAVGTMIVFLLSKNLLTLLLVVPVHGVCALMCGRDVQCFALLQCWVRTRLPALFANLGYWRGSSYSPLVIDLPNQKSHRCIEPAVPSLSAARGVRR